MPRETAGPWRLAHVPCILYGAMERTLFVGPWNSVPGPAWGLRLRLSGQIRRPLGAPGVPTVGTALTSFGASFTTMHGKDWNAFPSNLLFLRLQTEKPKYRKSSETRRGNVSGRSTGIRHQSNGWMDARPHMHTHGPGTSLQARSLPMSPDTGSRGREGRN